MLLVQDDAAARLLAWGSRACGLGRSKTLPRQPLIPTLKRVQYRPMRDDLITLAFAIVVGAIAIGLAYLLLALAGIAE